MNLYHRTKEQYAQQILRGGFKDHVGCYLTDQEYAGLWFSDRPLDWNEGTSGDVLFEIHIDATDEELADDEWVEEGKTYREWLIPPDFVNRRLQSITTLEG